MEFFHALAAGVNLRHQGITERLILTCISRIMRMFVRFSLDSDISSRRCSSNDFKISFGAPSQISKSHSKSCNERNVLVFYLSIIYLETHTWNDITFGIAEVSWPLLTVPTKLNVRCRMCEFSKCFFLLNIIAKVW